MDVPSFLLDACLDCLSSRTESYVKEGEWLLSSLSSLSFELEQSEKRLQQAEAELFAKLEESSL